MNTELLILPYPGSMQDMQQESTKGQMSLLIVCNCCTFQPQKEGTRTKPFELLYMVICADYLLRTCVFCTD